MKKTATKPAATVDIHAHYFPEEYLRLVGTEGQSFGVTIDRSNPEGPQIMADGEVRMIPLVQYDNGVRVRMIVSRRGTWPKHVEASAELYIVLKGEVIHITDTEQRVKAGEAILLTPGEPQGARVEEGGRLDQRRCRMTEVVTRLGGLSRADQARILGGNAAKLLGI